MRSVICLLLFFFTLFLPGGNVRAQIKITADVSAGYAGYQMKDLKAYLESFQSYSQYPLRVSESFPPSVNYALSVMVTRNKNFLRVTAGESSTSGRSYYSFDARGTDNTCEVKLRYAGLSFGRRIYSAGKMGFYAGAQLLRYHNSNKFHQINYFSNLTLGEGTEKTVSNAFSFSPFSEVHRTIGKFFLRAHAGYEFFAAEDLHFKDSGDSKIAYTDSNSQYQYVKLNPQGLRLDVGVGFAF